jgi:hypothetical protein
MGGALGHCVAPEARAGQAARQAAESLDVRCPAVEVTARGQRAIARVLEGVPTVVIPAQRVESCSDEELLALVAHEVAHLRYRDPDRFPASVNLALRWRLGTLAAAGIWSTVPFAMAWLLGLGLHLALLPAALVFVTTGLLMMRTLILIADRRTGVERRLCELRADIAAAQVAGPAATLSFLHAIQPVRWSARFEAWVMPTHPPARHRIAAVAAYDGASDPDQFARQYWASRR